MRQADELSITITPCAAIFGDHSLDTVPPALISAKSIPLPLKSNVSRSWHLSVFSPKLTSVPIERRDATA
jgi:hypothetical protein